MLREKARCSRQLRSAGLPVLLLVALACQDSDRNRPAEPRDAEPPSEAASPSAEAVGPSATVPGASTLPALTLSAEPARITEILGARWAKLEDTLAVRSIHEMDVRGDTVVVVDGADRVLFFDRDLRAIASFGRRGEGPGEFKGTNGVRFHRGGLVVTDNLNARATWLDHGLTVLDIVPTPPVFGRGIIARPEERTLLLPVRSATHHLIRVDSSGRHSRWGVRVAPPPPSPEGVPAHVMNDIMKDLVEPLGDDVYLLDGQAGHLLGFGPDGDVESGFRLPDAFVEEYFLGTGVAQHRTGGPAGSAVDYRPRFADFSVGSADRMAFVRPGPATSERGWIGGVIDVRAGVLYPLVSELEGASVHERSSMSAVGVDDDTLLLGTLDGSIVRVRYELPAAG